MYLKAPLRSVVAEVNAPSLTLRSLNVPAYYLSKLATIIYILCANQYEKPKYFITLYRYIVMSYLGYLHSRSLG